MVMRRRILLKDQAAKTFIKAATENFTKFTNFGTSFSGIGGYYKEVINPLYIAFDFTNGKEVFMENFTDKEEAKKYAKGFLAKTVDNIEI